VEKCLKSISCSRRLVVFSDQRAGYQLKYLKSIKVLHKESISTGKNSPLKFSYQTRNRVLMRRNLLTRGFPSVFADQSAKKIHSAFSFKKQKSHWSNSIWWRHCPDENRCELLTKILLQLSFIDSIVVGPKVFWPVIKFKKGLNSCSYVLIKNQEDMNYYFGFRSSMFVHFRIWIG